MLVIPPKGSELNADSAGSIVHGSDIRYFSIMDKMDCHPVDTNAAGETCGGHGKQSVPGYNKSINQGTTMKQRILGLLAFSIVMWGCFDSDKGKAPGCQDIAGVCAETSSRVIGSVEDKDGKSVGNALVEIRLQKGSILAKTSAQALNDSGVWRDTTDSDGKFDIGSLPGGKFVVKAIKDTLGISQQFDLQKKETKNLPPLIIINNGIIIGKVENGIVQQGDNAQAFLTQIGQYAPISQNGTFNFNNVPTFNTSSTTTTVNVIIVSGDGKTLASKLSEVPVTVKSGGVVQVDTIGTKTIEKALVAASLPIPESVEQHLPALEGGTLKAILISGKDTIPVEVAIQSGKAPEIVVPLLDATKKWSIELQGKDSTGVVRFEGKDTVDLSKENLETLDIPFARKLATLYIQDSIMDSIYTAIARTRKTIVKGPGTDSLVISATRTTAKIFRTDSAVAGNGTVVTVQYLDADGKPQYEGMDTLDITGAGKDTAKVELSRLSGSVALKGKFVDEAGKDLSGLAFDTAYALIYGPYMDTAKAQLTTKADGEFSASFAKVPVGVKWNLTIAAKSGKGERTYQLKDTLPVEAGKETTVTKTVKSNPIIPIFDIKNYTIEVGDTLAPELTWTPKVPDTVNLTLSPIGISFVRVSGNKVVGIAAGTAKVVASVQGLAQRDTFQIVVSEKEFSVADLKMEVDDTARAVLTWKTKPPAPLVVTFRSLNTTLASVGSASGLVTALAAGNAQIVATVTGITKPDTFEVTITEPVRDFSLTPETRALSATQGGDVSTVVRIARTKLKVAITLSITGAPEGVTAVISPATLTTDSSKITFNCNQNPFPGTYKLYLIGKTTGVPDRKDSLVLTVQRDNSLIWKKITSGNGFNCGINDSGFAYCWGGNGFGQIGIGSTVTQTRPIRVSGTQKWKDISAGYSHTCGVTTEGEGFCWGQDFYGGLGDGGTATQTSPVPVSISGGDRWNSITAGGHFSCGVTTDGRAFCWGYNGYGQLGDNTTANSTTRVQVGGTQTWATVQAGVGGTTCGLTTTGEAYCWGSNSQGTIGDGNSGTGANPLPVKVSGSKTWLKLSVGSDYNGGFGHACGVTTANDMYCWGYNGYGETGIGSTTTPLLPTLVLNDIKWQSVAAGYATTCGVNSTGKGFCWGWNSYGQAGNGTVAGAQSSPAAVAGPYTWKSISTGYSGSCGISEFDQVYCWGNTALGAGSTTTSYVPWRVSEPLAP